MLRKCEDCGQVFTIERVQEEELGEEYKNKCFECIEIAVECDLWIAQS